MRVLTVVVCLPVRVSVTSQCSAETAKRRIMQTMLHEPRDSSFLMTKISAKLKRSHAKQRCQLQVG